MLASWKFYFVRNCRHAKPKPKSKRIVIAYREDDSHYWGFFVNSDIHPFIKNNPKLLPCQVLIKQADYPAILDHDSYVDCTVIHPFAEIQLEDPAFLKTATKDNIQKVVAQSTILEEKHIKRILSN